MKKLEGRGLSMQVEAFIRYTCAQRDSEVTKEKLEKGVLEKLGRLTVETGGLKELRISLQMLSVFKLKDLRKSLHVWPDAVRVFAPGTKYLLCMYQGSTCTVK